VIEYKTFDPIYWAEGVFTKIFETFDPCGNGSYDKTSVNELRESIKACEADAAKDKKDKQFWLEAAEGYQLVIDNVLRECPTLDHDEEFLLLFDW
jgi:hypothetical protein